MGNKVNFSSDGGDSGEYRYGRQLGEGTWPGMVIEAGPHTTGAGATCVKLLLGVDGGPEGGVKLERYIRCDIAPAVRELLAAVSPSHLAEWEDSGELNGFDLDELAGVECAVLVAHEEYQGKIKPKAQRILNIEEV